MTDSAVDTDRVSVRTYVPAYQREQWDEHAEELDMSRSEFVRTMVQAGRRHFDADSISGDVTDDTADGGDQSNSSPSADQSTGADGDIGDRVVAILADEEFLTWEELLTELTDDVEQRLETALEELQADNRVRYSGRNGGYTLQHEQ